MTDSNSKTSSSVPPAANPLATEPISHLIRKYSIPTALTLMVNYLYNIADQIFVGQGVGITGMAATNVAFPLTIVTTALALMLGDGCSANLNLSLGRGEQDTADRTISHAVTLLVSTGVLLALFGSIFGPSAPPTRHFPQPWTTPGSSFSVCRSFCSARHSHPSSGQTAIQLIPCAA